MSFIGSVVARPGITSILGVYSICQAVMGFPCCVQVACICAFRGDGCQCRCRRSDHPLVSLCALPFWSRASSQCHLSNLQSRCRARMGRAHTCACVSFGTSKVFGKKSGDVSRGIYVRPRSSDAAKRLITRTASFTRITTQYSRLREVCFGRWGAVTEMHLQRW